jgi:hypothetical protein
MKRRERPDAQRAAGGPPNWHSNRSGAYVTGEDVRRESIEHVIERLRTKVARSKDAKVYFVPLQDLQVGARIAASRDQCLGSIGTRWFGVELHPLVRRPKSQRFV